MDELIEENMGLVAAIVNLFGPKNHTERQDLIDAGRIGLWKALQKFDVEKGNKLSTYAWQPIRWSIIREMKKCRDNNISLDRIVSPSVKSKENIWECYTSNITTEEERLINLRCEGYKFREICEIVHETPSAVKNKFYKLVAKLKEANVND